MTRVDYRTFADALAKVLSDNPVNERDKTISAVCAALKAAYPNFRPDLFTAACQPKGGRS